MKKVTRVIRVKKDGQCPFVWTFNEDEERFFQYKLSFCKNHHYDFEVYTLIAGVLTLTYPISTIFNYD